MNDIAQRSSIQKISPGQITVTPEHDLGVVVLSNRRMNLPSSSVGDDAIAVAKELDKAQHQLFTHKPSAFQKIVIPTTWRIARVDPSTSDERLAICFTTASKYDDGTLAQKMEQAARQQYCPIEKSRTSMFHVITGVLPRGEGAQLSGDQGVFSTNVQRLAFCILEYGILDESIAIGSKQNPFSSITSHSSARHLENS